MCSALWFLRQRNASPLSPCHACTLVTFVKVHFSFKHVSTYIFINSCVCLCVAFNHTNWTSTDTQANIAIVIFVYLFIHCFPWKLCGILLWFLLVVLAIYWSHTKIGRKRFSINMDSNAFLPSAAVFWVHPGYIETVTFTTGWVLLPFLGNDLCDSCDKNV